MDASAGGRRRTRFAMIRQPFRTSPLLSAPTGTSISGNTVASSSRTATAISPVAGITHYESASSSTAIPATFPTRIHS